VPTSLLFPILAIIASVTAYAVPGLFLPLKGSIMPLLTVIMFGMGLTLTAADFKHVAIRPQVVGLGVLLQYTVMPLTALIIGRSLALEPELIAGLVLVGCSPGGTASNVISYLAKADVALSVTLTLISTLLAVVATPVLTWLLVGQTIPVAVGAMLLSLLKIVLIPVLLGVALNTFFHQWLRRLQPIFPMVATVAIVMVIAIVVALNQERLATTGLTVILAVILHNLFGLLGGYWVPRLLGNDPITCRTLSIEVGMQNSGLSVALAVQYFSALAALPGAIFSIWHNLSGAVLASWWATAGEEHSQVAD
jgi:BASS family bile acid:Na+ symporter